MEEADILCDRIAIMDKGKIKAMDTPENLKDSLGGDIISLAIEKNALELKKKLGKKKWIRNMKKEDSILRLTVKHGGKRIPKVIKIAQDNDISITAVDLHKPSLEDVFLSLTGTSLRDREASFNDKLRADMRIRGRR
jgi:ABC-2 type transport system ATP-binding protein